MAGMTYESDFRFDAEKISRNVAVSGARGVTRATEFLRAKAIPLTPLDQGPLRESASVTPASAGQRVPEAALIFDTPYAAKQHEELDYHHDQGQAKYVEEPARQYAAEMAEIVATEIRRGVNG